MLIENIFGLLPNAVQRHMSMSQGSARDFLKQTEFVRTKVAGPFTCDSGEQEHIVTKLSSIDSCIVIYEIELTKLKSLKSGLQDDLLTGKKRVTPLMENMEVCS